jgi:hypothetical protein
MKLDQVSLEHGSLRPGHCPIVTHKNPADAPTVMSRILQYISGRPIHVRTPARHRPDGLRLTVCEASRHFRDQVAGRSRPRELPTDKRYLARAWRQVGVLEQRSRAAALFGEADQARVSAKWEERWPALKSASGQVRIEVMVGARSHEP